MKKYLRLFRVKHYFKNILLFVPAFFGIELFDPSIICRLIIAFICFSLGTSFIYIVNDLRDYEQDRLHEIKRKRPIAAGEVSRPAAAVLGIICFIMSFCGMLWLDGWNMGGALSCFLLYIVLNILYSFGFKKIAILDIAILASGFVLRVFLGAAVSSVECSNWLILTIMTISLFLGLGKRRNELAMVCNNSTRKVLEQYSVKYLDAMMQSCVTLGIVFYSLWSVDMGGNSSNVMIWTVPLVIALVMKYELDIDKKTYGDPIEVILEDKSLLILGAFYVGIIFICKYFPMK